MFPIIGVIGHAQAGKDTAADFLKDCGYVRLALADALKREVVDAGFCTAEQAWAPEKPPTLRRLLQWWGTEYRRQSVHPDYWLWRWNDYAFRVIQGSGEFAGFSIPDVRFVNEAEFVLGQGGILFCIPPNKRSETYREKNPLIAEHASEKGFAIMRQKYEGSRLIEIPNTGDITDFRGVVNDAVKGCHLTPFRPPVSCVLAGTPLAMFLRK